MPATALRHRLAGCRDGTAGSGSGGAAGATSTGRAGAIRGRTGPPRVSWRGCWSFSCSASCSARCCSWRRLHHQRARQRRAPCRSREMSVAAASVILRRWKRPCALAGEQATREPNLRPWVVEDRTPGDLLADTTDPVSLSSVFNASWRAPVTAFAHPHAFQVGTGLFGEGRRRLDVGQEIGRRG